MTGDFPDSTRGICLSCAIGSYRARDARGDACTRCPPLGVRCEDSSLQVLIGEESAALRFVDLCFRSEDTLTSLSFSPPRQIKDGFWRSPDADVSTITVTKDTQFYPCVNEDACIKPKLGVLIVTCATNLGYEGPLCGACKFDESQRFIRSGAVCAKCESQDLNVLALTAIMFGVLLFAIYITAIRSTNRRVGEYGGIIRRQLFSYVQVSDSAVLSLSLISLPSHLSHTLLSKDAWRPRNLQGTRYAGLP